MAVIIYGKVLSWGFEIVMLDKRFILYKVKIFKAGNKNENKNTISVIRHFVSVGVIKSYTEFFIPKKIRRQQ